MVDMNTDHISDTPDRIQQSVCPVSSSAATRGVTRMAGNPSPARRIKFKIKNISTQGQSSRGDAVSELPAALDTDNIFNQAELARKLSPPKLDRTTGKSVVNGNGAHSHDLDQSSSISNHMVSRGDGVRGSSCQIREGQVGHRDASRRHVDFLGVGSDLPTGTIIIDLTDKSPTITKSGASVNYMETTASEKFRTARAGGTLIPQGANQASSSNCSEGLNNKAKEIIHPFMGTEQAGEADTMRVCPRAPVGSFVNDDSTGISQQVWRTTHNHTIKLPMSLLCKTTSTSGMESGSSGPSNQGQETAEEDNNNSCRAATAMRSSSLRNRAIRSSKRKRKHTSSSYQPGESSSSVNELGSSCLASSDTTAGRNHTTRCHNISVIDIDDISPPEARSSLSGRSNGTSIDPNVSAQLEAYELLAWQLQEQLYNETPRIAPREEIDAIVAMSVQHEEDAEWTSRTVRAPARWISNDTRAFRGGYRAARIQPIDLNDYDALLAIDENNNQHTGASESQINNLPLSVFQSTSTEEPCMVCLENPSVGDTIRTLPCFHKFHKECIDEWLRRKKQCPVCMCGITSSWPMQF